MIADIKLVEGGLKDNLRITLIRSGITESGQNGIYVGRSDEELTGKSAGQIWRDAKDNKYPPAEVVFVSPMLRARQTAELIYPTVEHMIKDKLCAYHYGEYTGMNYKQIKKEERFLQWEKTTRGDPFPGAENYMVMSARSKFVFKEIAEEMLSEGVAWVSIVTHMMVISAIMRRFSLPRRNYADWKVKNGGGYTIEYDWKNSCGFIAKTF